MIFLSGLSPSPLPQPSPRRGRGCREAAGEGLRLEDGTVISERVLWEIREESRHPVKARVKLFTENSNSFLGASIPGCSGRLSTRRFFRWEGVNDFAGTCEVHLFAGVTFYRARVRLEPPNVFLKLRVLLLDILKPMFDGLHLAALPAQCQPAILSENFMNGEGHGNQNQSQNQATPKAIDLGLTAIKFSLIVLALQALSPCRSAAIRTAFYRQDTVATANAACKNFVSHPG